MNIFILLNNQKILSNDRTKDNFLRIPFEDIEDNGEKFYKSKIIVNDIRMDFSINLIQKVMNYNINETSDSTINIRPTTIRIERKAKKYYRSDSFDKNEGNNDNKVIKNKISEETPKSRLPLFRKVIKAVEIANKIRNFSNKDRKSRSSTFYNTPLMVEEGHIDIQKDDDMLSQQFPFLKRKSSIEKEKEEEENKEKEEKHKLRGMNTNNNFTGKNKTLTLTQMITSERQIPKKLKTIKTEEYILEPVNFETYLSENEQKKKLKQRETFCEGFFIASFPKKDGQVIEKSQSFPAPCGHKECSELPAMKPEIILRYPLEDTKTLEMNNLAATICFPTGIKVCYSERGPVMIKDYVTPITNQKGERYYMMTYHFYLKVPNHIYSNSYEMHPLKHHLMKFADNYLNMSEDEMDKKVTKQIQKSLEQAQNLGFRDNIFIPYCICLISKYPYVTEMKKCLQSIYSLIIQNKDNVQDDKGGNIINDLIMHIINSVPIPDIESRIQFYIPYFYEGMELKCPNLGDLKIMNSTISDLLNLFSIDNILTIFRLLIFEKKILFIDGDYTRLTNVTDNFISLLYPFQWMHTYIPIMSDQMLKYLETFLPFLNGIHLSLMPLVTDLFNTGDMEEGEEMFLIYINQDRLYLGSSLIGKKIKPNKYIEENVPALPYGLEKELKNKLKKIKDEIEYSQKKNAYNRDLSEYHLNIRNVFIEMFVQMFHEIDKYLCFLDDDVVFNKNLFMETVPKEDKKFYDEFIDTQLFQLFTQNFVNDELDYFKSMKDEFNKNNQFSNDKNEDIRKYIKKIYILNPDYLGIKENNKRDIEMKVKDEYNLKKEVDMDGFIVNDKRITEYIQNIDNDNYNNKNCNIYLIPEKEEKVEQPLGLLSDLLTKKQSEEIGTNNEVKKFARVKTRKFDLSEKDKELIKEKIRDFAIKIFKSEEIKEDSHLKKDLQNDINTTFGREYFVFLLARNVSNVILLKASSFNLLGTLIYNTLLYILQVEENDKILEQIVVLIKSTMFFAKEEIETIGYFLTEEKKNTITLWEIYKKKIQRYPKVNQANLWNKWYEINLNAERGKENKEVKIKVILKICDLMIELELIKSFIKNTLDKLIKKTFGGNEENNKKILQQIVQKIIHAKYISKAKK